LVEGPVPREWVSTLANLGLRHLFNRTEILGMVLTGFATLVEDYLLDLGFSAH